MYKFNKRKEGVLLATEKQVQTLAKKIATLIGKMDLEINEREIATSQEAANIKLSKEFAKKNNKKD